MDEQVDGALKSSSDCASLLARQVQSAKEVEKRSAAAIAADRRWRCDSLVAMCMR
jgi:hypothetical protein